MLPAALDSPFTAFAVLLVVQIAAADVLRRQLPGPGRRPRAGLHRPPAWSRLRRAGRDEAGAVGSGPLFRVLVAHAEESVSAEVVRGLEREPGIAVVGSVTDGATALRAVRELAPNSIVVGTLLGDVDAPTFVRTVRAQHPRVIVMDLEQCHAGPEGGRAGS